MFGMVIAWVFVDIGKIYQCDAGTSMHCVQSQSWMIMFEDARWNVYLLSLHIVSTEKII